MATLIAMRPVQYDPTNVILMKFAATAVVLGAGLKTITALAVTADGDATDAVAMADVAASGIGPVLCDGIFQCQAAAGVDFAIADQVYVASAGSATFDAGSMGNLSSGRVVNKDPASAGVFEMRLVSAFFGLTQFQHA